MRWTGLNHKPGGKSCSPVGDGLVGPKSQCEALRQIKHVVFSPFFYFTRSVLKPSTLPDIQVTDVDATVKAEGASSNAGENELGLSVLPSLLTLRFYLQNSKAGILLLV